MSARREPVSRRDRPAKPPLSRPWIVETAMRVMREEGLGRVTMRRLAAELDTGPASLYVYVANTSELHAAMLEELLGEVDVTPVRARGGGDWRDRIESVLTSYIDVLAANPGLARSALVARPSGPNYLQLLEALLALSIEGGIPDAQAAWGVDLLLLMATATVVEHTSRGDTPQTERDLNALVTAVGEASPTEVPTVAALGAELLSGSPEQRRSWAVRMLLEGALNTPIPAAPTNSADSTVPTEPSQIG